MTARHSTLCTSDFCFDPGTWHLQTFLDDSPKVDWSDNRMVYRKGESRLIFLRRLRSSNVCTTLLWRFYQSAVTSAISSLLWCSEEVALGLEVYLRYRYLWKLC